MSFIFGFIFGSVFFRRVCGLVCPFALRRLDILVALSRLLGLFVLVISFTLRLEYFLRSFDALTELEKLRESLGFGVKHLGCEIFFNTPLGGITLPTRGSRLLVGVVLRQKTGTSLVT